MLAALIGAADAVLLLSAGTVLSASRQFHASVFGIVGGMLADLAGILPQGFLRGIGAILGFLGAGWWQEHLLVPALGSGTEADLPALGGVLAAPLYLVLRRSALAVREPSSTVSGAPPHRVFVARTTTGPGLLAGASTAVPGLPRPLPL